MKQLVIVAENKVGTLATILQILSDHTINVRSISTERGALSEIRLIVDSPERAKQILSENQYTSHVDDIVVLELTDSPGELAQVTKMLADNNINVDYIYGIDNGKEKKGLFALKTSIPIDGIEKILKDYTII